jgi:hypothetical protein
MARFKEGVGPHFSVIRHDEWKEGAFNDVSEIGSIYQFIPTRVDVIETAHKRLWVLIVEPSAELMAFREKYATGDMPHGHEFHITIAQEHLDK